MPRQARDKGVYSVYHVIQRGNEGRDIFVGDGDKQRFIDTLVRMKGKYGFLLYAYCLMDNHAHLLIDDNGNDISQVMKSINISYVHYFNDRYDRWGHLFQDRFRSQRVDNDPYLLEVSKYIHSNPVKAGLVNDPAGYRWSSYPVYVGEQRNDRSLVDGEKVLALLSDNPGRAVRLYRDYVLADEEERLVPVSPWVEKGSSRRKKVMINTLEEGRVRIKEIAGEWDLTVEEALGDLETRDRVIRALREHSSLTLKEIGELFGGISESRVSRILNRG